MLLTKLKSATAVLLMVVCLIGTTAAGLGSSTAGEQPEQPSSKPEGGKQQQVIKVYPVGGLTSASLPRGTEAKSLMRVMGKTIEPASWSEMGGDGSMEYYHEGSSLVIRQSPDIQKQVQDLLDTLRKTKTEQPKSGK